MQQYRKIYKNLGFSEAAVAIAIGELKIPNGTEDQPAVCYGFPPAMIPMWSNADAMIYTGYWRHWFCQRRPSFVKMYVNVAYRVSEVARSFEQLAQYLVLEEITFEEEITEDISSFAQKLGVDNLAEIDQLSIDSGDDPLGLVGLPFFKNAEPLICLKDSAKYSGDFPHDSMEFSYLEMTKACSLELSELLEKRFIASKECPEWFKAENKKECFNRYLSDGKYSDAWFTLNSNGWMFKDAKEALGSLAKVSKNKDFEILAEAWCSLDHDKYKLGY